MNKLLRILEVYTIYITVFVTPLLFLPTFFNPFLTAKIAFLVTGVALALIFRLLRIAVSGSFEYNQGSFDFPIFLLILAYILSGIYASPNKPESFFLPGAATVTIASAVLYFLANQLEDGEKNALIYIFIGSGFMVSMIYLMGLTGLFEGMQALPQFMRTRNFTTQGALLPTAIFLASILPYSIGLILTVKDYLYKVVLGCGTALIAIVLVINTFNMFTDRANFNIAGFESSLSVTFDALKSSPILGVGPSNYITAYTRFRPLSTNQNDDWTARYSHARNYYLTAITETGLVGTFALVLLVVVLIRMVHMEIKSKEQRRVPIVDFKTFAVLVMFVLLFIFPATSPEIIIYALLGLALMSTTKKFKIGVNALAQQAHFGDNKTSRLPAIIIAVPLIAGVAFILFTGSKFIRGERNYKIAIDHLAKNEGSKSYEALQTAINLSPNIDRYHAAYSQVNFLLAEAIARKEEISESERTTIATLIQQAIREAKSTVALNPQRAGNWEILGNTYRNIMTLSQGADAFAIQSYGQAVLLDPINPNLRISLGGVWFAVKNYELAIDTFKLAVIAKPDHANARYNLAAAYRENKQFDRAIAELRVVLTLVEPGSKDYETAQKEIESLETKKASAGTDGESLNEPETTEPLIDPLIELPEGSEPEISPTPTPSATPTSTPTPSPTPTIIP